MNRAQPPNSHELTQTLLPWYVSGQLDGAEFSLVEAHLRDCPECRAELRLEQRLEKAVAGLPFDAELGWTEVRGRIAAQDRRGLAAVGRRWFAPGAGVGWAIAAQFVLVIAAIAMLLPLTQPQPRYHALSAPPPASGSSAGDVIIAFRPDARAEDLTRVLRDSGARLVDGPTAADAYVLATPPARRAAVLAKLRANADIVMAEPIDPAARR